MQRDNSSRSSACEQQDDVNEYFQSSATYWKDIYFESRLWPAIYRERQDIALKWIDRLQLPVSSRILEIGCGAGFLSIALGQRGHFIDAMDSTAAMAQLAAAHVAQAGLSDRIRILMADAHALPAAREHYDLVVALGVLPWLHSERQALAEMKRVLRPGAHLLVTADNNARLNRLLDPFACPLTNPLRSGVKWALRHTAFGNHGTPGFQPKRHYPKQIDRILETSGLRKVSATTIGFGVLTFAGKQLLDNDTAIQVHRRLQSWANQNIFPLNKTGLHYMVLSQKE